MIKKYYLLIALCGAIILSLIGCSTGTGTAPLHSNTRVMECFNCPDIEKGYCCCDNDGDGYYETRSEAAVRVDEFGQQQYYCKQYECNAQCGGPCPPPPKPTGSGWVSTRTTSGLYVWFVVGNHDSNVYWKTLCWTYPEGAEAIAGMLEGLGFALERVVPCPQEGGKEGYKIITTYGEVGTTRYEHGGNLKFSYFANAKGKALATSLHKSHPPLNIPNYWTFVPDIEGSVDINSKLEDISSKIETAKTHLNDMQVYNYEHELDIEFINEADALIKTLEVAQTDATDIIKFLKEKQ